MIFLWWMVIPYLSLLGSSDAIFNPMFGDNKYLVTSLKLCNIGSYQADVDNDKVWALVNILLIVFLLLGQI